MKIPVVFVGLALLTGALQAQTPAAPATLTPAPAVPAAKVTDPKKAAEAKKAADAKKKEEPMGKIAGVEIPRGNGTFLGLEVVDSHFKLTFYDKKKKPMKVDVTRAAARWDNRRSSTPSEYRTVLNGGGTALVGAGPVLPPLVFTVRLALLKGEGETEAATETYVVAFHG